MFNHYLLLIYRNFLRSKSYFLINLTGLTTGLTCTLLIFLWVRDEYRMNKFHEKDARLYQILEHQKYADEIMTTTSTPGILAETLKQEMPEIEYAATTTWISPYTLSVGDHNVKAEGYHAGEDYFNIFSYKLIQGDPGQVLKDKYSIIISRDLAKRLFGSEDNVLGKTTELQHDKSFHVTGVFEPNPHSSLKFDFILSFEYYKDDNKWVTEWGNNGPPAYVVLREGSDPIAFEKKIKDYVKGKNKDSNVTLFLQKYSDRYLHGKFENGLPAGGRIEYVRLFSIIAVFILVIACINFMNLSTARASRKAKEVGIKKSIGAARESLVIQYMSESIVTALLSLVVALAIVWLFLPQFNVITDKRMELMWNDSQLYVWFIGIALFTGIMAGSYPALYLSGFKPAAVLKGVVRGSMGELWARKGLVVFQFFLSVILIVSVLVIYKQIEYVQNTNLGYKKDHLIQLPREGKLWGNDLTTFLAEVRRTPGVVSASSIGHSLLGRSNNTSGLKWEGKNPEDDILFENMGANYGIFETLGLEFVEGRPFSEEFGADTSKIIFNEAAIRVMNMKDPIGKKIRLWDQYDLEIVGVVKDFHFESLHDAVNPAFFRLSPGNTWTIMIRLEAGKEKETLAALTKLYGQLNPGFTFEYQFQDVEYADQYAAEQRVATLSSYFASMAILISCLGLFGLAAFTAERRLKEIGIRKALGSSSANIVMLLSGDFTRMVLLSILLALPASYWLLDQWLAKFAFHIDLKAWFFIVAGLIALFIAWITVASQAIKAASVNPVKCLRTE
jgi:putative ABC transport system permease protein